MNRRQFLPTIATALTTPFLVSHAEEPKKETKGAPLEEPPTGGYPVEKFAADHINAAALLLRGTANPDESKVVLTILRRKLNQAWQFKRNKITHNIPEQTGMFWDECFKYVDPKTRVVADYSAGFSKNCTKVRISINPRYSLEYFYITLDSEELPESLK